MRRSRQSGDRTQGRGRIVFDDYLSGLPAEEQQALRSLVDQVAAVAPEASEGRSYDVEASRPLQTARTS